MWCWRSAHDIRRKVDVFQRNKFMDFAKFELTTQTFCEFPTLEAASLETGRRLWKDAAKRKANVAISLSLGRLVFCSPWSYITFSSYVYRLVPIVTDHHMDRPILTSISLSPVLPVRPWKLTQ